MVFITHCDSPALWQTYLPDPASITMEGILIFIKRLGIFFGQCSEICGVNHGFMPIVIVSLPTTQFHHYIMTKLELN